MPSTRIMMHQPAGKLHDAADADALPKRLLLSCQQ